MSVQPPQPTAAVDSSSTTTTTHSNNFFHTSHLSQRLASLATKIQRQSLQLLSPTSPSMNSPSSDDGTVPNNKSVLTLQDLHHLEEKLQLQENNAVDRMLLLTSCSDLLHSIQQQQSDFVKEHSTLNSNPDKVTSSTSLSTTSNSSSIKLLEMNVMVQGYMIVHFNDDNKIVKKEFHYHNLSHNDNDSRK